MSQGFIQIPRSLLDHPAYIGAPPAYRCVLICILQHACFLPCQQFDHGKIIDLLPGQFMCTERRLAELAGVTKNDVHRSLKHFLKFKIVNQEVNQRKNILSIIHEDTYDLIKKYSEPRSEPRVNQERTKSEPQKDNVDNAETVEKNSFAQTTSSLRKKTDIFFDFEHGEWENIKPDDIATWQQSYPAITVNQELLYMREWCLSEPKAKSKKLWRKFITSWLGRSNEKKLNFESSKAQNPGSRAVLGGKRLTEYDTAW